MLSYPQDVKYSEIQTHYQRPGASHPKISFCLLIELNGKFLLTLLRLLTHVGFLRQNDLILSEVFFAYGKKQESRKKIYHNRAKNFIFLRRFDRKNKVLGILRNLIDKLVFK